MLELDRKYTFPSKKSIFFLVIGTCVLLFFTISGALTFVNFVFSDIGIHLPYNANAEAEYQAVFLSNGQVYFGQIEGYRGDMLILTNIYYFQQLSNNSDNPVIIQEGMNSLDDVSLVKLGTEIHSPEDRMFVNKRHILHIQNLLDESQVVEAIKSYQPTL